MILVTGTKRSGTSMWMQILAAGGFPIIGEAFSADWGASIRAANPHGFWESSLRQGVFYATNPHPDTGRFLRPDEVREHAVKVFVPGLVRSDFGYIRHVIATLRPWREYAASVRRLYALEDAWLAEQPAGSAQVARAQSLRPDLPPEVEWWFEQYELLRDAATRGYPFRWTTYARVLDDPEAEVGSVFRWLGRGDVEAAVATVDRASRTQRDPAVGEVPIDSATLAVMDDLYATCHAGKGPSEGLIRDMNAAQLRMEARWGALSRERMREDLD